MTTSDPPVCQPAVEQLLDLACATREDIDRDDLHGAILGARTAGWTWPQVLTAVAGMLARGETPYDLRAAARTVVRSRTVTTT